MNVKKQIFAFAAALLVAPAAFAAEGTLKPNAVFCTDMKLLVKYLGHIEAGEQAFADRMVFRAQCSIKQTPEKVVLRADMDPYVKLETIEGFTVWARKADYQE